MMWEIWRQDDNGNRFLVDRFPSRQLARDKIEQLTRSPHKQFYWLIATGSDACQAVSPPKEEIT